MPVPSRVAPPVRITNYRDLQVWQKSVGLCESVYRLCRRLPRSETFALGDQLRRSAVSVASNIAEGHARNHTAEYLHFLATSRSSLAELETQLIIAVTVDYFTDAEVAPLHAECEVVSRMLAGLVKKLREREDALPARKRSRSSDPRPTHAPRPTPQRSARGS